MAGLTKMCGKCWVLRVGCVEAGLRYGRDTDISDGLRSEAGHVSEIGHVSGIIWNLNQSELLQVPAKCGIKPREEQNQVSAKPLHPGAPKPWISANPPAKHEIRSGGGAFPGRRGILWI